MIPSSNDGLAQDFTEQEQPGKTLRIDWEQGRITGFCDGVEAVKQAVYKILNTERYEYLIYSWNYGTELQDLFGKPAPYVYSELKRRITEALTQDDRITGVSDFQFERKKGNVLVSFTVSTIYGDLESQQEVNAIV